LARDFCAAVNGFDFFFGFGFSHTGLCFGITYLAPSNLNRLFLRSAFCWNPRDGYRHHPCHLSGPSSTRMTCTCYFFFLAAAFLASALIGPDFFGVMLLADLDGAIFFNPFEELLLFLWYGIILLKPESGD